MRRIISGSIVSYSQYGHLKIPKEVKTKCPMCTKNGRFTLKVNYQANRVGLFSEGICSECKELSSFVIMFTDYLGNTSEQAELYIYDQRHPLQQIENDTVIPDDLIRAYRSAINVQQSKDNSATAVMSKRVLEGVIKHFQSEPKQGNHLAEQLEQLPKHVDFTKPIVTLSQMVKPGSHLNKILELEHELDEDMAELLVDLLGGLMEYLYILPSKMETIHQQMNQRF
ncbi:hypothetical protein [Bacillus alkalicellulosilyticus]|uniref:hypothetical protein n=1 Tax=Alkalihalobacterium alkalicellulosilyticum TaxID=1912214 RepID=UPI000996BBE9|nr:hypothetical protein [Bacillus alkalicellulosilyticus]